MRARKSIVLPSGSRLHVEYHEQFWFLWLAANTAFTDGFGVRLYTDGRMEHWRIHADGYEERLDRSGV